jgi:arachidonate 5-lipoxygenase
MVDAVYADDAAVAADGVVQAWAYESSSVDKAAIPGFPRAIDNRQLLADCLRVIVWTASAMHSTLNYPQYPYTATPLNRAASLYKLMPGGEGDIDGSYLVAALPPPPVTVFQGIFSWLLSIPAESTLLGLDAVGKEHPEVHAAFQADLVEIGKTIDARNQALVAAGLPPYPYLSPANIASSISI